MIMVTCNRFKKFLWSLILLNCRRNVTKSVTKISKNLLHTFFVKTTGFILLRIPLWMMRHRKHPIHLTIFEKARKVLQKSTISEKWKQIFLRHGFWNYTWKNQNDRSSQIVKIISILKPCFNDTMTTLPFHITEIVLNQKIKISKEKKYFLNFEIIITYVSILNVFNSNLFDHIAF